MDILDAILGNAKEIDKNSIQIEFSYMFIEGENVNKAYKLIRDIIIFTNKRIVIIDKQGVTGSKIEFHTIPFNKISTFSVESVGFLDRDAELKIWVSGKAEPIILTFNKNVNIKAIEKDIAKAIL